MRWGWRVCSATFDRGGETMKRYWITAVMVGMLALVIAGPASAQGICKAQAVLSVDGHPCAVGAACGQAEVKVQNAVAGNALLKIKAVSAVNKFDADVSGLEGEKPYRLAAFVGSTEVAHAFFFTNTVGTADVDIRGLSSTCDIKSVTVTKFGVVPAVTVLRGTFGPEVEVEVQVENEIEAELEVEA